VLAAGGYDGAGFLTSAELYTPAPVPCTLSADCGSGFCADGVCCNTACTATCQACSAAAKGSGVDGSCGFIAAGTDPLQQCTPATCTNGVFTAGTTCNGMGTCGSVGSPQACGNYTCSNAGCLTSCTIDAQCAPAADLCHLAACDPSTGICSSKAIECSGTDPCKQPEGTCDPGTGACNYVSLPDGSPCPDGTCYLGTCLVDSTTSSGSAAASSSGTSSATGTGAGGSAGAIQLQGNGCSTGRSSGSARPWLLVGLLLLARRRRVS
jgi:hypothetical protein